MNLNNIPYTTTVPVRLPKSSYLGNLPLNFLWLPYFLSQNLVIPYVYIVYVFPGLSQDKLHNYILANHKCTSQFFGRSSQRRWLYFFQCYLVVEFQPIWKNAPIRQIGSSKPHKIGVKNLDDENWRVGGTAGTCWLSKMWDFTGWFKILYLTSAVTKTAHLDTSFQSPEILETGNWRCATIPLGFWANKNVPQNVGSSLDRLHSSKTSMEVIDSRSWS